MNIYVGNLPYSVTEEQLKDVFAEHGDVARATLIKDNYSGQSKGFGFIEMDNQSEGEAAIKALDGQDMGGRNLKVNVARPREDKPRNSRPSW